MELTEHSNPAVVGRSGEGRFELVAGKRLKIETTPDGAEVLDAVVPSGKVWAVTISVAVIETDA